eukprot:Phypoly_transcript_17073.p1 GENE.Phypoly_transcript_17073~~Phypoly_transcript_17073.p1  ORF type:complete len:136 (-),score=35.67 Phypoly_transcript_17073:138-545(-)
MKVQIQDVRVKLSDDIQRHMEAISCTDDIQQKQHVVRAILGIKQTLDPFPYTSTRAYVAPALPDLENMGDVINKDDARKLFDFFRVIHFTLYDLRMRLCGLYEQLSGKVVAIEYLTAYAIALKNVKEFAAQLEEM